MKITLALSALLLATLLQAESVEEDLEGFDDAPVSTTSTSNTNVKKTQNSTLDDEMSGFEESDTSTGDTNADVEMEGFDDNLVSDNNASSEVSDSGSDSDEDGWFSHFSGKITQQMAVAYNKDYPQNVFASLRQTLFLDYERKYDNGLKVKMNVRGFYDPRYDVGNADYYPAEVEELRQEVEVFEAYLEWKAMENLDVKVGRQVVVWGRSDSIRINDILNPLDFRRPGMQDIENLRLPTSMLKFDYQIDNWRITPIAILEQRFTKYPPFGSIYFPLEDLPIVYSDYLETGNPLPHLSDQSYSDVTFALSVGADFEGWDVSFYAARVRQDQGFIPDAQTDNIDPLATDVYFNAKHEKTNMFGTGVNYLTGSWLLKMEMAYFSDLIYTSTQDRTLSRTDMLLGMEYSGFTNTTVSYDVALRHFNQYDERLYVPFENLLERDTYQQALRINSNYMNDTLHLNYLVSVFGKKVDEGGFQRAWIEYEVADAINTQVGIVDYFGGSPLFERVSSQNVIFMDMSYNF